MGKPQSLSTLFSRKLQQALKLKGEGDAFAVQTCLEIVNDVILDMARAQVTAEGDEAEKGRRSIIFIELNAGVSKCIDAFRTKTESPQKQEEPRRLHLSHLKP